MLQLFRKSTGFQLTFIIVASAVLWFRAMLNPLPMIPPSGSAPLYGYFYLLLGNSPHIAAIVAFIIALVSAALLNTFLYERGLLHESTLLPMFLYMMTVGVIPAGQQLNPIIFVNLLIIISLRFILRTDSYLIISPNQIFTTTLLISISSLFFFPVAVTAVPFIIVFIAINKIYNWRDITILILGFLAPYVLILPYHFMNDNLTPFFASLSESLANWSIVFDKPHTLLLASGLYFMLILTVTAIFTISYSSSRTIIFRNNSTIIVTLFITSILLALYSPHLLTEAQPFALPFAFTGSIWLLHSTSKKWVKDSFLAIFTLLCIACSILIP